MPKRNQQMKNKRRGYDVEKEALEGLRYFFPRLRRVGSPAHKRAAADLVQDPSPGHEHEEPIDVVVTKDLYRPLLITSTLQNFMRTDVHHSPVRVQVKARKQTWVGKVYDALRRSK